MKNRWLCVAAALGALSIASGAFGAHALEDRLSSERLEWFDLGARYQLVHAVLLVAVSMLLESSEVGSRRRARLRGSAIALVIGVLLFSGSLYAMALSGWTRLGMVTPLGGASLILGWGLLAWAGLSPTERDA